MDNKKKSNNQKWTKIIIIIITKQKRKKKKTHPLKLSAVFRRLDARTHIRLAHDLRKGGSRTVKVHERMRRAREAFSPLVIHLGRVFLHVQARDAHLLEPYGKIKQEWRRPQQGRTYIRHTIGLCLYHIVLYCTAALCMCYIVLHCTRRCVA